MCRLVSDSRLIQFGLTVTLLVVENGRAVFHASESGARLDVSQTGIGKGPDQIAIVVHHLPSPTERTVHRVARVARVGPYTDGHALRTASRCRQHGTREPSDPNNDGVHRDR